MSKHVPKNIVKVVYRYPRFKKNITLTRNDVLKIAHPPFESATPAMVDKIVQDHLDSGKSWKDLPIEYQTYAHRLLRHKAYRSGNMKRLGLDVGTKNIVLAYKDAENVLKYRHEINGFFKLPREDNFAKNMLEQLGVPFVESGDGKSLIALGSKAEDIAYTFGKHLKRPMESGVISPHETNAMTILAVIIRSLLGKLEDDSIVYYSVPGQSVDKEVNVDYHIKIIREILNNYTGREGTKIQSFPINEARSVVLSQIPDKTGIGISLGAGQVNIAYCLYGMSAYEFSIIGSGDKIDFESARVTGNLEKGEDGRDKPKVLVTKAKEATNLSAIPTDNLGRAIYLNYEIVLENVAKNIIRGFKENEQKARAPKPMPIVCAGGTSMAPGFLEMFKRVFAKQSMPFEIGEITMAKNPFFAVSEGCLFASELHQI